MYGYMSNHQTFMLGNSIPEEIESVKATGQFCEIVVIVQLCEHIKNELKGIDLNQQKFKPSFIKFLLDKVKTVIKKTKSLDKEQLKDLATQCIKILFPTVTDLELKVIDDILDTLIDNKLIKAVDKSLKGKFKKLFIK
jgi:hypothetical protein